MASTKVTPADLRQMPQSMHVTVETVEYGEMVVLRSDIGKMWAKAVNNPELSVVTIGDHSYGVTHEEYARLKSILA
jgi:hypothetical protein